MHAHSPSAPHHITFQSNNWMQCNMSPYFLSYMSHETRLILRPHLLHTTFPSALHPHPPHPTPHSNPIIRCSVNICLIWHVLVKEEVTHLCPAYTDTLVAHLWFGLQFDQKQHLPVWREIQIVDYARWSQEFVHEYQGIFKVQTF